MNASPVEATPYETLGVHPAASTEELRRAYRRMLRATHPDTGGVAVHFHAVQAAWELVGGPSDRAAYDNNTRQGRSSGMSRPSESASPTSFAPSQPQNRRGTRPAPREYGLAGAFPADADRLNPPGAHVGGDNETVLANGCYSSTGTRAVYGAVARYVFDVGAWDNSSWVVVTGASGDPDDPHYLDQHERWAAGETVPMRYDWSTIAAVGQLTLLRPAVE